MRCLLLCICILYKRDNSGSGCEVAKQTKKRVERAYEWFLELPVPVVLVVLWLAGATLVGLGAAALYVYWLLLRLAAGV